MRDWQPEFIALWQQGLEIREIAQRLGLPYGTVQSRAHRLQHQGKIQPRGRGGAYPRQRALARQASAPAPQVPPTSPAPPAPPAVTFVAVPEIQEMLSILRDLQARVGELEQTRVTPALPAPQAPPASPMTPAAPVVPAPPTPERKEIQQWTIRLSKALIAHLKAVAYERRMHPSELVEDWLWQQAHTDRSS
jgi:DNA-binding transcriptional MocR family regulator